MLDAIKKEIQFFIIALDRTKKDLKADGSEDRYLLERIASLKKSYENGKTAIDHSNSTLISSKYCFLRMSE